MRRAFTREEPLQIRLARLCGHFLSVGEVSGVLLVAVVDLRLGVVSGWLEKESRLFRRLRVALLVRGARGRRSSRRLSWHTADVEFHDALGGRPRLVARGLVLGCPAGTGSVAQALAL